MSLAKHKGFFHRMCASKEVWRFAALPVTSGDAFLLRSQQGTVLVDGGQYETCILELLDGKRLHGHICLLVCTHYDADHIKGILGILKSRKYSFHEIWLPEVIGSLGYTISKGTKPILDRLSILDSVEVAGLISDAKSSLGRDASFTGRREPPITTANLNALKDLKQIRCKLASMAPAWPLLEAAGLPAQVMLANLASAIAVTSALVSSGVTVRWLKYSGSLTRHKYGFGMTALNSTETRMTCYSPDVFLQQLYLTAINVRSLVFKFSDGGHPEILFCADSNLSFTAKTQPITLIANSLVTAPHHGAATCDEAYDCIAGSDLIYVRSDEGRAGNPGKDGFLKQANRYCTICRQGKTKRQKKKLEVEVLYTGCVPPTVTGRRCECM